MVYVNHFQLEAQFVTNKLTEFWTQQQIQNDAHRLKLFSVHSIVSDELITLTQFHTSSGLNSQFTEKTVNLSLGLILEL